MQSQQQKRRRKPGGQLQCEPTPDSLERELWQRNAEESPFLRLPPEIRNRIYALVLTVGQIHVRYRPWRHRKRMHNGTPCTETVRGGYYAVVLGAHQDPWAAGPSVAAAPLKSGLPGLPAALTLLSPVCRQLYRDTAVLPFCLNAWSFENARIMERYLLREKRFTLPQRRAIGVLIVSDDLPTRAMEKYLGGLRVVVWKDGKTFQRWELNSAAELQRLVESTQQKASASSSRLRGASGWHLYE